MKKNLDEKQAKFFCESCGAEVKSNSRVCPYCGKFFSSVRCPRCGKTGSNEDFKKGCPACGYAVVPGTQFGYLNKTNSANNSGNKKHKFSNLFFNKQKEYNSESLPFWIYIVCITVLAFVVGGVYSCL